MLRTLLGAFALFLLTGLGVSYGQATHQRTATNFLNPTNATTIAATFGANSTTGNLIVVHITYSGQTISVTGVADNKIGNAYSRINGPTNWNGTNFRSELWYAFNINGGAGAITITATLSGQPVNTGGLKFSQIYVSEFSNIKTTNPLDVKSVTAGTAPGAGAFNSGSATTNYTNEMVYGAAVGGTMGTINVGGGFTSVSVVNSNLVEFRNVVAAGSNNAVFNATSAGTYVADMATFITNGSVLPVTLMSFDATQESQGKVTLEWATASELNSDYFEVQRSKDGAEWMAMKKVTAAGHSTSAIHYGIVDESPEAGVNYYRLKQVDLDGKYEYSAVRKAEVTLSSSPVRLYPNPTADWLHIDGPGVNLRDVSIISVLAVNMKDKVSEVVNDDSGILLNVSAFPAGMYIMQVGRVSVRFSKQ